MLLQLVPQIFCRLFAIFNSKSSEGQKGSYKKENDCALSICGLRQSLIIASSRSRGRQHGEAKYIGIFTLQERFHKVFPVNVRRKLGNTRNSAEQR